MADDIKNLEFLITTTYDGSGASDAAAGQEKLTNTGKGLATQIPKMDDATKAYTISTEAEYVAVQKAHDSLAAKIPILQAAGKETASYDLALANLSEALSTEQALTIAQSIEQKALNQAKLDAFEASRAEARGQFEEAEATEVNTVAMREQLVVLRELMAGRLTRLPGSLSILAGASGAGPALTQGIMAATMAFVGLDMAISSIEKHDAPLEKILGENLEAGIDKAQALADAWNGIADAVSGANQEFDSAEAIYERGMKGASTPKQALSDKANEVTNAKLQEHAAETKAASFKLPESDGTAKAEADAMAAQAKANREKADSENLTAAQLADIEATASQGIGGKAEMLLQPGFWKMFGHEVFNHGLKVWDYGTSGQLQREQKTAGASDVDTANAQDREAARIQEQVKERDKARSDAERSAAEATKDERDFQFENNPQNAGSLRAKINESSAGEIEFAADIKRIQQDLSVHGPRAKAAMQDAAAALKDAVATLASLAALGDEVKQFREQLADLKMAVERQQAAADNHF